MNFLKNKNTSIRLSQGYSDVAAPGAGGSDPAVWKILLVYTLLSTVLLECVELKN